MKTANDYSCLTDNERIEAAIRERNTVIIPQRRTNTRDGVWIPGGLTNASISNVIARSPNVPTIKILRPDLLVDVTQTGVH